MNYFCKRHLWLVSLCIVTIWGIWATQVVSAQVDTVDLITSPNTLPTKSTDIVTVTISYTVTEPTQLFYYPPADFEVVSNNGATSDPNTVPPPGLNGVQPLKWDVDGSGAKEIRLRVKENATPGEKTHRAALNNTLFDDEILTLSEPVTTAIPALSIDPDLQINFVEVAQEVEPSKPFTLTIVVQNIGQEPANDIKIGFNSESMVLGGEQFYPVGSIAVGQSITNSYPISTGVNTADGLYSMTVTLLNGEIPYDTEVITILVKQSPQNPALELIHQEVYENAPGKSGLNLVFKNNGAALPIDAQLVLRYPENVLSINHALLNSTNNSGVSQADGSGHAWSQLPPIDWHTEDTFVLNITDLLINSGFTPETDLQILFVDGRGEILGSQISLSSDTIEKLAESALTPIATSLPTSTTSTLEGITPAVISTVVSTGGESTEIVESTSVSENNEWNENSILLQWLLIGLIVVAVLLLVAVGIYLLLNARKQANSKRNKEETKKGRVIVGGGSPYLQANNGSSFPITTFPFTIGRGESNNLIIDESFPQWQSMSRNHARIIQHQQGYVIEDMGSQNKLRVQGRLTERNLLRNGWQVLIGGVEFTFFDGSSTLGGSA